MTTVNYKVSQPVPAAFKHFCPEAMHIFGLNAPTMWSCNEFWNSIFCLQPRLFHYKSSIKPAAILEFREIFLFRFQVFQDWQLEKNIELNTKTNLLVSVLFVDLRTERNANFPRCLFSICTWNEHNNQYIYIYMNKTTRFAAEMPFRIHIVCVCVHSAVWKYTCMKLVCPWKFDRICTLTRQTRQHSLFDGCFGW